MTITRKARGAEIPRQAQRVFLCCDEKNTGDREALAGDIISQDVGMDCVVSWTETDGGTDEQMLRDELTGSKLLALYITTDLLISIRESGFPAAYRIAKEVGTPILPIAHDDGLFPIFTELAGAVHGIARTDAEYRAKLKAQLENFLASEELLKEIGEKAFTSGIFLSYRKMDLQEARDFMRDFHDTEGFEAVSVWYDYFLTGGGAFDKEIKNAIENSNAFVLLVTPHITEKNAEGGDNFVAGVEFPYASSRKKPIVPVEADPCDPAAFALLFQGAGKVVSKDALIAVFRAKLGEDAYLKILGSERAFLLGTAYLRGVRVERDAKRAVKLLTAAAEATNKPGLKAAVQSAELFEGGKLTGIDYPKALDWRLRASAICKQVLGEKHPDTSKAYSNIGGIYISLGEFP
jgi:hypothetical protein